jgi:hypothetical protein
MSAKKSAVDLFTMIEAVKMTISGINEIEVSEKEEKLLKTLSLVVVDSFFKDLKKIEESEEFEAKVLQVKKNLHRLLNKDDGSEFDPETIYSVNNYRTFASSIKGVFANLSDALEILDIYDDSFSNKIWQRCMARVASAFEKLQRNAA